MRAEGGSAESHWEPTGAFAIIHEKVIARAAYEYTYEYV